jgi:hypothetical protein
MSIWEDLFAGTEVKDGVASAIRSSITEGQAHMLTKGLATEDRWALFKLGYTGAEVGGFWAHRTDGQIQALIDWVNEFGDAQMCNAEITRRKRESNFTAKLLFEDLVDTDAAPQYGGDAATDSRLDRERRESLELRARVDEAVQRGDFKTAMALQAGEWSALARRIAEITKEHNLRPIEGGIFSE